MTECVESHPSLGPAQTCANCTSLGFCQCRPSVGLGQSGCALRSVADFAGRIVAPIRAVARRRVLVEYPGQEDTYAIRHSRRKYFA